MIPEPEAEATAVAAEKESAGEKEAAPKKSGPRKSTQPKKAKAEGKASGGSSEDNTKEVAAES